MTKTTHEQLAADIAQLRAEGEADDGILATYRDYAPHYAADIDKLLGEGAPARDILDSVVEYERYKAQQGPQPENSDGVLETSRKALQYGAANAAVGLGRTAHWAGEASGIDLAKDVGETITGFGKSIAPTDYKPASADFFDPRGEDKGPGGFGWRHLPRTVLEGIPGLLMDVGAGAATGGAGFLASNAARTFGPAMDARVENNGGKPAEVSDYAIAGGSAALQAYLNKVGINPALNGFTKGAGLAAVSQIPAQVAKAGAVDAAAGAAGNVIDQAGVSIGTDKGLTVDPHQIAGAAAASGAMGGAVRGVKGIGDVTNAVRFRDMDDAAAARLADRFYRLNITADTPEGAFKAVEAANSTLVREARWARKEAFKGIAKDQHTDARELLDLTESMLGQGTVVSGTRFAEIKEKLGDTPHAAKYVNALEDRSALNLLKSMGRYEDGYFAGGVASSKLMGEEINPLSWLKNTTKRTIGTTLAGIGVVSELPVITKIMAGQAAAKVAAAQAAAYGTARGVDAITSSRNPVRELTNRFRTDDPFSPFPKQPQRVNQPRERLLKPEEEVSISGGTEKAFQEPVQAQGRPDMGMGSREQPKAASEAPSGSSERIEPAFISITERGYTVNRARDGIANVNRYVAKTKERMSHRANFGDELELLAEGHSNTVRGLINKLNTQAHSFAEAQSMIEDAIQSLPWDKQAAAWDIYSKHEAALSGTYHK